MEYSQLGTSQLKVSRCCLGTMTWGQQNTEGEAHEQMDYAFEQGVNFFDTAELYAIPPKAETQGKTEEYIGTWFQKTGKRQDIVLATKIAGQGLEWIRNGEKITGSGVTRAVEGSLKRLQTDYIDVYQLHWPNRAFPHFGRNAAGSIDFSSENDKEIEDNLLEILQALGEAVKAGKIKYTGLSDDTSWGIMTYLRLAKDYDLPRITSIQNEFSLLDRSDDPYVAEVCVRENVAYLPWSPLAFGMLSGKYANGARPEGTRWTLGNRHGNFRDTEQAHAAVDAYLKIAQKHGLDPCQMAIKFCDMQNFVTSTIIGATKMDQLTSNIAAFDIALSDEVLSDIHHVYRQYPLPF